MTVECCVQTTRVNLLFSLSQVLPSLFAGDDALHHHHRHQPI